MQLGVSIFTSSGRRPNFGMSHVIPLCGNSMNQHHYFRLISGVSWMSLQTPSRGPYLYALRPSRFPQTSSLPLGACFPCYARVSKCMCKITMPFTHKLILQRHSEAIEIMYSTNTFFFSSPFIITNFFLNHTLLPYRNLIRTITISIGPPEPTLLRYSGLNLVSDSSIVKNLVAGAWDSIHSTLATFSNLRTVQVFIPDQRSSAYNSIFPCDYEFMNNRIFQFFTYHKTKFALKSLEIYIPFLEVTKNDHYAAELQGQLNAEGVACTVVAGGIITLGELRPASVKRETLNLNWT
jgi:hypothetical protein